ncbi:S-layer homology domain-containing protein [Paenibacillus sp. UMB4589-SE434]|uniref:S-layer homology domain-containing protein n=1 Tax=Paenibacillus sp. UMB4589-SE434 TaxID=3046314 RepID=UPI00254DC952|nr:S-layer homology domain-containing protein [Paenibacillus sp. UMB4589-SE434]MDK8182739.1 S-layer homology domain-containing protein [Paenibacillus sp. UMB4589-SE434]
MRKSKPRSAFAFLVRIVLSILLIVQTFPLELPVIEAAGSATFEVNSFADTVDVSSSDGKCLDSFNQCSLRAAIMESNRTADLTIILVPPGLYTLTLAGTDHTGLAGDLDIHSSVTIRGMTPDPSQVVIQAGSSPASSIDRIFELVSSHSPDDPLMNANVTIENVTLQNAKGKDEYGGGISAYVSNGSLTIRNSIFKHIESKESGVSLDVGGSALYYGGTNGAHLIISGTTFSQNRSTSNGGAVFITGTITANLQNNVFSNNSASRAGGAIYADSLSASTPSYINIENSSFINNIASGNTSSRGGALTLFSTTGRVVQSTFVGNVSSASGGAISVESGSPVTLAQNTIVHNQAIVAGGGLWVQASNPKLSLHNNIVAENTSSGGNIAGAAIQSAQHNLIGPGHGTLITDIGNQLNVTSAGLEPLTVLPGKLPYIPLQMDSPAIDAGSNSLVLTAVDMYGTTRILDSADPDATATVDIGAIEAHPTLSPIPGQSVPSGGSLQIPFRVGDVSQVANVTAVTYDPALIASTTITGSGQERILEIRTIPGKAGSANVLLTATALDGRIGTRSIDVTITAIPDLTLTKTHTGNFKQGQTNASYTLIAKNIGAAATSGPVTVTDLLPPGLIATSITGAGWTCAIGTATTCTRSDVLAGGGQYPPITLLVNVNGVPSTAINRAEVSGGGDGNPMNNSVEDPTLIESGIDLTLSLVPQGTFSQNELGTYSLSVTNQGSFKTDGSPVVVSFTTPAAFTLTGLSGSGWSCSVATSSCTRTNSLPAGANYPIITAQVMVAANAPASVSVNASIAGGGDTITANNTASHLAVVEQVPDISLLLQSNDTFNQGDSGKLVKVEVLNEGGGATVGTINLALQVPPGLQLTGLSGNDWICDKTTKICTRNTAIPAHSSSTIMAELAVDPNAPASIELKASASGGGEQNTTNNSASYIVQVVQKPDLVPSITAVGPYAQHQTSAKVLLTAQNNGTGPSAGPITLKVTPPAGWTLDNWNNGADWSCNVNTSTCSYSGAIDAGAAASEVEAVFRIASNASAAAVISLEVQGGSDVNNANNTVSKNVTVKQLADLKTTLIADSTFRQGQQNASYRMTVSNAGNGPSEGSVTAKLELPSQLLLKHLAGAGWTCDTATAQCTRSDAVQSGDNYPDIIATVAVALDAPATLTAKAVVSGGGEVNSANSNAEAHTAITAAADLTALLQASGTYEQGQQQAEMTVTVANYGQGATTGPVHVQLDFPQELQLLTVAGSGWSCDLAKKQCTRADELKQSESFPTLLLRFNIPWDALASYSITAEVSGGAEINGANNKASLQAAIKQLPDLTIQLSPNGSFKQGQSDAKYGITVHNKGASATTAPVTVQVQLPSDLTLVKAGDSQWICDMTTSTCVYNGTVDVGKSAPVLVVMVKVASNAPATLTARAAVSGGGEKQTANNTTSYLTTVTPASSGGDNGSGGDSGSGSGNNGGTTGSDGSSNNGNGNSNGSTGGGDGTGPILPEDTSLRDIEGHWAKEYIVSLVKDKVINGYEDRTFRPNNSITRAEFAVLLDRLLQLEGAASAPGFTDKQSIPDWAAASIYRLYNRAIVKGYDNGQFKPHAIITRAEMAAMIYRAFTPTAPVSKLKFTDADRIPVWAQEAVQILSNTHILTGYQDGSYRPHKQTTRAETAAILYRIIHKK